MIAPDQTDRIQVILRADYPPSETQVYMKPGASIFYLLRLHLVYGADSKDLATRTIAVACPGNRLYLPEAAALRSQIQRFEDEVAEWRGRLEQEMQGDRRLRDRLPIDWTASPPRRSDLPEDIGSVRLNQLHDSFWDPRQAITAYLETAESVCRDMAALPSDLPDGVAEIGAHARSALPGIVALRAERAS